MLILPFPYILEIDILSKSNFDLINGSGIYAYDTRGREKNTDWETKDGGFRAFTRLK